LQVAAVDPKEGDALELAAALQKKKIPAFRWYLPKRTKYTALQVGPYV